MTRNLVLALLLALAACGSKKSGPSSGSAPPPAPPPPAGTDLSQLGSPCGADGSCPVGTCVSYVGIGGAKGGELKSCEIKCADGTACPTGTTCKTIADGPGQVCRA